MSTMQLIHQEAENIVKGLEGKPVRRPAETVLWRIAQWRVLQQLKQERKAARERYLETSGEGQQFNGVRWTDSRIPSPR